MEQIAFSYNEIHQTVAELAARITSSDYDPEVIVAIGTGGYIPARIIKTFLKLPIYTVGISLYLEDHTTLPSPRKIQWIDEVEQKLEGKRILLVDEVDDSRTTLEYCIRELLAHSPAALSVAVLHNKNKEKRGVIPAEVAHYWAGQELPDAWIKYPWDAVDIVQHDQAADAKAVPADA
ncbi:MAG: phosphoribosyltransferase [Spirochaetaceae bacterium]|nr:MAG: phosphoribosyltransferase [Spirochaetaceae bacterium]